MKKCYGCKVEKPESDFPPNAGRKSGLNGKCRDCYNHYMREYYLKNKEKHDTRVRARNKAHVSMLKSYIRGYLLQNPCITCGELDIVVLEFDHVNCTTKKNSISALIRRGASLAVLQEEIKKCQVLCANCHRRRTAKQFGSHRLLD